MSRSRVRVSIVALILFAAYALFVVVVAIAGSGGGPVFWGSIGVIIVLAVAALWLSRWLYRRRVKPT